MTCTTRGLPCLAAKRRLAVVGCGGKTALVERLALAHRRQKVLVMPTATAYPMRRGGAVAVDGLPACLAHTPRRGIQFFGVMEADSGKMRPLPPDAWPRLADGYDLVLMEADGSRQRPCKGWRQDEPAVPAFANATVGVVTLGGLGRPADEATVLRLPEFTALTGVAPGGAITLPALAAMVAAPNGMFRRRAGVGVLLINQVEDLPGMARAEMLADAVRRAAPGLVACIYAGSVRQNRWQPL